MQIYFVYMKFFLTFVVENKYNNNMRKNVYKMSEVNKMFTKEQVEKMSTNTEFNYEDAYFHYDEESGWIESLNDEDIEFYNKHVEDKDKLVMVTKLQIVA